MSRITIERVIESITSKFNLVIQEALEKASITKDLIDVVYIVGEATPLSLIQQEIVKYFTANIKIVTKSKYNFN